MKIRLILLLLIIIIIKIIIIIILCEKQIKMTTYIQRPISLIFAKVKMTSGKLESVYKITSPGWEN